MATPYYNEAFTFLVPFSQIQVGCLEEGAGGYLTQGQTDHCLSPPPPFSLCVLCFFLLYLLFRS